MDISVLVESNSLHPRPRPMICDRGVHRQDVYKAKAKAADHGPWVGDGGHTSGIKNHPMLFIIYRRTH